MAFPRITTENSFFIFSHEIFTKVNDKRIRKSCKNIDENIPYSFEKKGVFLNSQNRYFKAR
jgi:hypothetical protein